MHADDELAFIAIAKCFLIRRIFGFVCVCTANHLALSVVNTWLVEHFKMVSPWAHEPMSHDPFELIAKPLIDPMHIQIYRLDSASMFIGFKCLTNRCGSRIIKRYYSYSTLLVAGTTKQEEKKNQAELIICMYQFKTGNKTGYRWKCEKSARVTENNNETWFEENFIYRAVITVIIYYYRQCSQKEKKSAQCRCAKRTTLGQEMGGGW